ncbi:MAG: hybrid sensor histidine kinase/response regulator [Bacteroidetes bacterium]|nr:MAG: hybrid sensor histidine kinase/response regulator [Bacteroidota bacterium]
MENLNSATKILIIDDDEDDFFITSEYIKSIPDKKFIIDWCFDYEDGLSRICDGKYDLYLIDYRLGSKTGLDLIKEAIKNNCEEPIILLTGKGNRQVDIEAMKAGAFDYQVKPELNVEKLERTIRYALDKAAALKAVRKNERKFRSFFERSNDAVFLAGPDLVFKDVNPATEKLFEYSKEELNELSLYDLIDNQEDVNLLRNRIVHAIDITNIELDLVTKSGEKKSCTLSITKEIDMQNHINFQGIIHDISNLKKAEKSKLQVEKLEATGRLARILAHEIRNPLNNINLSIEQLKYSNGEDESKIYLDIIQRNANNINELIGELLNSFKPAEPSLEKVSLQQVMKDAIANAIDRIQLKKIELNVSFPDEPMEILGDPEKLKIAFVNIIINAVEAMEEGVGELRISIIDGKTDYMLIFEDNGCGIPTEDLSKLFEPYFTSKKNGLGLGLSATLNILQSHKATIEVQSTLGKGTNFIIRMKRLDIE